MTTTPSKEARPSEATKRMAKILGCRIVPRQVWTIRQQEREQ